MKKLINVLLGSLIVFVACSYSALAKGKPGGTAPGNPEIAYFADNGDSLYVMNADRTNPFLVFEKPGAMLGGIESVPTWHPSGPQLFFSAKLSKGRGWGLYRVDADGANLTTIIPPPGDKLSGFSTGEISPVVGLHGKYRIAFMPYLPRNEGIFVADVDTASDPATWRQIAPPRSASPTWSADGRHLAYRFNSSLYLASLEEDLDGNLWIAQERVLLEPEGSGLLLFQASFSKVANSKIYFSASTSSISDVWALHLDDAFNPVLLQSLSDTPDFSEIHVSGSGDDSYIVYGRQGVIVRANSDGSGAVMLTPPSEVRIKPALKR